MDKFRRPQISFDKNPNSSTASKEWTHWYGTFETFLAAISSHEPNKPDTLINYVDPTVYDYIAECTAYEEAIDVLKDLDVKPKTEAFAGHLLATRMQQSGENLDEFMQALKQLAKDCYFKSVTANQYREDTIRDAFIIGLQSNQSCDILQHSQNGPTGDRWLKF